MAIWREPKRQENLRKHGMDFADVERFDFDTALVEEDRDSPREQRFRAIGYIGDRLCFLVFSFTPEDEVNAISLRPATRPERRRYEER